MRYRDAVGEDDVAADTEGRVGVGDGYGVVEGRPSGHESGGRKDTGAMKFSDGPIDAWGQTKVVSVDDEAGSHVGQSRG